MSLRFLSVILLISIVFSQSQRVKRVLKLDEFVNYKRTTIKQFDFFRQNTVQLNEYEEANDFHFIGLDPNDRIVPHFQISTKNIIDTLKLNYVTLLRSEVSFHQLKPKFVNEHAIYSINFEFNVLDEHDQVLFTQHVQKDIKLNRASYKDFLFDKHKEQFSVALPYGEYQLLVKLTDLNSKIETESELEFQVRNFYRDKLLVSDLRFFDSVSKKEITTQHNVFSSVEGDIIVYFDSYKKNTGFQFLYDVEMNMKKKGSETFLSIFETALLEIFQLGLFSDTTATFYETILFDSNARYNQFQFRIQKSDFRDITLYEPNYGQRYFEIIMKPKLQVLNRVKSSSDDENILRELEMTDSNYVNMTIESDIDEVIIVDTKDQLNALTSIGWDSIPNTRNQFLEAFTYLSFLMPDSVVDALDTLDEMALRTIYGETLTTLSGKTHRNEILLHYDRLLKRIHFANENFFYLMDSNNESLTVDKRHRNGWFSDKGLLYLRFGLPDEITGQNFITKEGQILYHYLPAKQKWFYEDLSTEYFFFDNELVHKKQFSDL